MKYELMHASGRVSRMTLLVNNTTPEEEISKWDEIDRSGPNEVLKITAVDEFTPRPPAPEQPAVIRQTLQLGEPANQSATGAAQYTDIPECTVADLAELEVNHAMVSDARGPNDDAGKGTGMYCVRIGGVWKTTVGTPVSA